MTLFTIVVTATIAWANLRNDVKAQDKQVTINTGRIDTIEKTLPEIKTSIGKIDTNIEWIKKNIK